MPLSVPCLQLMSVEPLGTHGLPPWDVVCIHYTCDPNRTDVLMRASHIIGDGQLFMKLIKQIMEPLDAAARADFEVSITNARAGTPGVGRRSRRRLPDSSSSGSLSSSSGGDSSGADELSTGGAGAEGGKQQQERSGGHLGSRKAPPQLQLQAEQQQQRQSQQQPEPAAVVPEQQHRHHKQRGLQHWWKLFVG